METFVSDYFNYFLTVGFMNLKLMGIRHWSSARTSHDTHPMKSNVDDTQPRESDFEDTHTGESVVGDTHLWDSDVDYLHSWDWSDVDDTHPGEMLTSPTRGNLMLTPTPGKLMLTSPTRGRESDVEDGQSQKSSVQGTFPYTVSNPVNCAELSEWTFCY